MKTTAKVVLNSKLEAGTGDNRSVIASFSANYANGQNSEWAMWTPTLQLSMTLKGEAADRFIIGQEYTLTFEQSE